MEKLDIFIQELTLNNAHELKGLHVRKTKLDADIKALEEERNRVALEIGRKKNELNSIQQKIDNFASHEPVVTEHAMLRYIERVLGIDLVSIQERILTAQNRKAIEFAGNCKIKSEGVELVVKDRKVVSVV